RILLDPSAHCDYFARATIKGLAQQYLRYGRWKAQMVKRHPRSIKLRHLAAPTFVSALVLLPLLGWWWRPGLLAFAAMVLAYASLALACALQLSRRHGGYALLLMLPLVFSVIHLSWGGSFLLGLLRAPRN
ncbi:MAG: hypothetical protein ACRD68_04050, partial [Pyrinomonadaceae bacterium]